MIDETKLEEAMSYLRSLHRRRLRLVHGPAVPWRDGEIARIDDEIERYEPVRREYIRRTYFGG